MCQDGSRSFASDHRTHHVADGQRRRALQLGFALACQRVRGFTGLADAHGERFGIEDGIAITELAAVVHFDRQARQPLDHELSGQPRVPAGAACHDAHRIKVAELLLGNLHLVQKNFSRCPAKSPSERQGVMRTGARLLENFFLHEMLVAALFRHDRIPGHMVSRPLQRLAVVIHHRHAARRESAPAISPSARKKIFARMFQQARGYRCRRQNIRRRRRRSPKVDPCAPPRFCPDRSPTSAPKRKCRAAASRSAAPLLPAGCPSCFFRPGAPQPPYPFRLRIPCGPRVCNCSFNSGNFR